MLITQPPADRVSSAKNLPPWERQFLAVEALSGKTPVSRLAASLGVSRKFGVFRRFIRLRRNLRKTPIFFTGQTGTGMIFK